jgi:hypothetical protein
MVKVTLKTISEFKGTFDINHEKEKKECIIKILDLCVQGYTDDFFSHLELSHIFTGPSELVRRRFSNATTIESILNHYQYQTTFTYISEVLDLLTQNTIFNFVLPNENDVAGGGLHKEYINLQKGGKRLVRYGSRGGRYYMKGGKKVYIK